MRQPIDEKKIVNRLSILYFLDLINRIQLKFHVKVNILVFYPFISVWSLITSSGYPNMSTVLRLFTQHHCFFHKIGDQISRQKKIYNWFHGFRSLCSWNKQKLLTSLVLLRQRYDKSLNTKTGFCLKTFQFHVQHHQFTIGLYF